MVVVFCQLLVKRLVCCFVFLACILACRLAGLLASLLPCCLLACLCFCYLLACLLAGGTLTAERMSLCSMAHRPPYTRCMRRWRHGGASRFVSLAQLPPFPALVGRRSSFLSEHGSYGDHNGTPRWRRRLTYCMREMLRLMMNLQIAYASCMRRWCH